MFHAIALAVAAITVWAAWVHFHPYRTCRWCRDERKKRRGCWRCHGAGVTRRWGAWCTHKLALAVREVWAEWRSQ
jgi:hypothetical protein